MTCKKKNSMRRTLLRDLVVIIAVLAGSALAQEKMVPEVTVIQSGNDVISEYRINGSLYMLRIAPNGGQAYYLLDTTGDGLMDTRQDHVGNDAIPQWVISSW